jgi:hypothetical protein
VFDRSQSVALRDTERSGKVRSPFPRLSVWERNAYSMGRALMPHVKEGRRERGVDFGAGSRLMDLKCRHSGDEEPNPERTEKRPPVLLHP